MVDKSWRVIMEDQRKLKKKGAAMVFDRISLLKQVHDDVSFRSWCDEQQIGIYDYLDTEVDDINCGGYLSLVRVLSEHPAKHEWTGKSLRTLIAETIKADHPLTEEQQGNRNDWKGECEKLRKELIRASARIEELERVVELMAGTRQVVAA